MLIIKSIKPVLFSIEEYSYFLLFATKNPQTSFFYEFCFNSTWKKWEPDYIANIPLIHTAKFGSLDTNDYNRTPSTLKSRSETLVFITSTEHYWRTYIPLTVLSHFALMVLWSVLKGCKLLRNLLVAFSIVRPLVYSLYCQNTQYLSFRAFVQLLACTVTTRG